MTYKDCLYYPVCHFYTNDCVNKCGHFKNKSDFVEVVRCKDCDVPHNKWTGCPNLNGLIPPPDFYCAYGKLRSELNE